MANSQGRALQQHFERVIADQQYASAYLGLAPASPAPSLLENLASHVAEVGAQVATLAEQLKPREVPLYSVTANKYIEGLRAAQGDEYTEVRYQEHRRDVFLAIIGDKPVDQYTKEDLQKFVIELSHLPRDYARFDGYEISKITQYIEDNKVKKAAGLAHKTIVDNYLTRIKTVIKEGCNLARVPYTLSAVDLRVPKTAALPRQQIPPDYKTLQKLFNAGKSTGVLADLMVPLLGFFTGRRLGILVNMRATDIFEYHGMWVVAPKSLVTVDGERILVPIKTEESLQFYVLNSFLDRIGFIEWARKQEGFVFASLHSGVKDPARTASKRMGRVFARAGVSPEFLQTFHSLRHARRNEDRDQKVDPGTSRWQAGRKPGNQHDEYGRGVISRAEVHELASAELPKEIDWTMFRNLNFDELASNRRSNRRKLAKV
ncbi:MAG: hypothetical protein EON54_18190 [Alcaligenaceae bacterium]|nr:MAG: hypothetical protein EON54_18190 [Alcaligenaceae bacterium]